MVVNAFVSGLIAILTGYFLGSFPSAYLFTRWITGKDIRKLGGGNIGGLNTFKEAGILPAIAVAVFDVGKGALAVAITHYTMHLDKPYVLMSALGAVMGHNWMPWLKFSGGKGMGATVGTLVLILPVYGYTKELAIFAAFIAMPLLITRNIALSNGIGLLALPFIAWLSMHSGTMVVWSIALGLIIAVKFTPTALAALQKNPNIKDYIKGS
ncbi:MAG: glycerol-3-phosphate acyltransferase [Dehalococcoidia bacterium]|nr:glycerol-3-phosphate acyltransferase [Dehalococcoidia bacterium]